MDGIKVLYGAPLGERKIENLPISLLSLIEDGSYECGWDVLQKKNMGEIFKKQIPPEWWEENVVQANKAFPPGDPHRSQKGCLVAALLKELGLPTKVFEGLYGQKVLLVFDLTFGPCLGLKVTEYELDGGWCELCSQPQATVEKAMLALAKKLGLDQPRLVLAPPNSAELREEIERDQRNPLD